MKVEITVPEEKLDEVFKAVEKELAARWFGNDVEEYEEWAGDIVGDGLDTLLDKLNEFFGIQIWVDP